MSYSDTSLLNETLRVKEQYNISIFVESGCQIGDSLEILSNHFTKLYSCDIDKHYTLIAIDRLIESKNIEISNMDGAEHLEYLYNNGKINNNNFILFSDGHNYEDKKNTSQLDELNIMIKLGLKPIVIYHDFKNPNMVSMKYDIFDVGENSIELIKNTLDECYGVNNYNITYNTESDCNVGYAIVIPK